MQYRGHYIEAKPFKGGTLYTVYYGGWPFEFITKGGAQTFIAKLTPEIFTGESNETYSN